MATIDTPHDTLYDTPTESVFQPTRQSPINHLHVLRNPTSEYHNTTSYLSPALHNASDTWVRFLRSSAREYVDDCGQARNQHKLRRKSVSERKAIREWCHKTNYGAATFVLSIHDAEVIAKRKKLEEREKKQSGYSISSPEMDDAFEEFEDEDPRYTTVAEGDDPIHPSYLNQGSQDGRGYEDMAMGEGQDEEESNLPISYSRSSLSTTYSSMFDGDEDSSGSDYDDDDDPEHIYSYDGPPDRDNSSKRAAETTHETDNNNYNISQDAIDYETLVSPKSSRSSSSTSETLTIKSSQPQLQPQFTSAPSIMTIEPQATKAPTKAEERLASAWDSWDNPHHGHYNKCSWLLVKAQDSRSDLIKIASKAPTPIILVTSPEGAAYHPIERQAILPMDFYQYTRERDDAQAVMETHARRWRLINETYPEFCRREKAEAWWESRKLEDNNRMLAEELELRSLRAASRRIDDWDD